jgi:hypothetical protein
MSMLMPMPRALPIAVLMPNRLALALSRVALHAGNRALSRTRVRMVMMVESMVMLEDDLFEEEEQSIANENEDIAQAERVRLIPSFKALLHFREEIHKGNGEENTTSEHL